MRDSVISHEAVGRRSDALTLERMGVLVAAVGFGEVVVALRQGWVIVARVRWRKASAATR